MPGIGTIGTMIAGGILGLGTLAWIWMRLRQAEEDRLKRAGLEAYTKADIEADKQEQEAKDASAKAQHAPIDDPTDWR